MKLLSVAYVIFYDSISYILGDLTISIKEVEFFCHFPFISCKVFNAIQYNIQKSRQNTLETNLSNLKKKKKKKNIITK